MGRTLLACVTCDSHNGNKENSNYNLNSLLASGASTSQQLWQNCDELLAQVRQICADKRWRQHLFNTLFCNSDQRMKDQLSLLVKSTDLAEPIYALPNQEDIERYETTAQMLQPQSLAHMVYLSLAHKKLSNVRAKYFSGLNFSTKNLSFCGSESLNRLDMETFLYATVIQTERQLEVEHDILESYQLGSESALGKPRILPFVNLQYQLCTEEQLGWWHAAYQVYKNLSGQNLAELRSKLQHGIEAVRGINGPKVDIFIILKLGEIFVERAKDMVKPVEKGYLEARAEILYKHALNMLKLHQKGVLEPFHKYFKYAKANSSAVEREIIKAAEKAVSYLAGQYFRRAEYEEFIEDFNGIQVPFATYLQADAYRRLDEADKTPKKGRRVYLERAQECLNQTQALLKSTQADPDHPLNSVVQMELKGLHQAFGKYMFNEPNAITGRVSGGVFLSPVHGNNSSTYEDAEEDSFAGELPSVHTPGRRLSRDARRESFGLSNTAVRNNEMEKLIKEMMTTLTFVKEELTDNIKPEVLSMRQEIGTLQDKISHLEDSLKKSQEQQQNATSTGADAASVLDDIFIIEDALQNQLYTPNTPLSSGNNNHNINHPNNFAGSPFMPPNNLHNALMPQAARLQNPNTALHMQQNAAAVAAAAAYGNSMFNPNYAAMAYYNQTPYMLATQGAAATQALLGARNPLTGMSYMPPTDAVNGMNYNVNTSSLLQPPVNTPQAAGSHLYGLLQGGANAAGATTQPLATQVNQLPAVPTMPTAPTLPLAPAPPAATPALTSSVSSTSKAAVSVATTTASNVFNKAFNNTPVEKLPPANVVITSSDPLPNPNSTPVQAPQMPLSVTIPSHHIKSTTTVVPTETTTPAFSGFGFSNNSSFGTSTFSFKPQVAQALQRQQLESTNLDSTQEADGLDKSGHSVDDDDAEAEYDPHPDFKPIIPLPDEIEVKTGEENEQIIFCYRAKLFRHVDKEWKERGIGEIKILKHPDGHSRVLMRREQIHKICANHKIDGSLKLSVPAKETKGFVWAANDFADGELQLEKFLIRFKLPETAQQFKLAFENAVAEAKEIEKASATSAANKPFDLSKSTAVSNFVTSTPATKMETTPNIFAKPQVANGMPAAVQPTAKETKESVSNNVEKGPSPFAGFSFGTSVINSPKDSPFTNLFGNLNKNVGSSVFPNLQINDKPASNEVNKSTVSESGDEEYVPTAQFTPVIPLPDLIEANTGEENELVLFEYRAKLLRFDKSTSEWKDRGLGNIKLLQQKEDINHVRLLMRRDQVLKLCCNQRIYKDTKFMLANTAAQNAVTWAGQDYSENELVTETLTLRFKTAETTKDFLAAVHKAQDAMTNVREAETVENTKKQDNDAPVQGFGTQFKPKLGSWACEACYINNNQDDLYCVACDSPKDSSVPKKPVENARNLNGGSANKFNFGFQTTAVTPTFNFNKSAVTNNGSTKEQPEGFGDKFKPKLGSWSCTACYTSNKGEDSYCVACEAPKDDSVPKKDNSQGGLVLNVTSKFNFGFGTAATLPTATTTVNTTTTTTPSIKDKGAVGDVTKSFNFSDFSLTGSTPSAGTTATNTKPAFSFSMPLSTNEPTSSSPFNTGVGSPAITTPFSLDKKDFNFTMKPKSPGGNKLNRSGAGGDADILADDANADDNEYHEEENNTYFSPVIPLPDKIDVKTGEEDEDLLYVHRAKLYRFVDGEWKERGLGDVKILRHRETNKLRVVMRREQVLKICLNHVLNNEVEYKAKDDKSWLFVVNDFSEGLVELEKFSLRFKNKDIAAGFMQALTLALDGTAPAIELPAKPTASDLSNNNVSDINEADKELADKLKLPYSMYTSKPACAGCRGCNDEDFVSSIPLNETFVHADDVNELMPMELPKLCTPPKLSGGNTSQNRSLLKQSTLTPNTSFAAATSPQSSSNLNNTITTPTSSSTFSFMAAAKDNKLQAGGGSFVFGGNANLFGNDKTTAFSPKTSIFGNAAKTEDKEEEKNTTMFGGTGENLFAGKSVFGAGSSIFGNATTTADTTISSSTTGSIFGGTTFNASSFANNDGKPLFGSTFGSNNSQPLFGGFANLNNKTVSAGFISQEKEGEQGTSATATPKTTVAATTISMETFTFGSSGVDFASLANTNVSDKPLNLFSKPPDKTGGAIQFVGLTHEDAFSSFQKKSTQNDDSTNKLNGNDSAQNVSGDHNENYDPYYAPIIELPKEIVVSTGEENETKLYGERAKLYRYDSTNKEWKERGVGELKILEHKEHKTYRLLLRREQVQKLVLNHAIGEGFTYTNMENEPRSLVWATMNYAESSEGVMEKLAIRFKKQEQTEEFSKKLNKCIENAIHQTIIRTDK